jgi:hypothetical protein
MTEVFMVFFRFSRKYSTRQVLTLDSISFPTNLPSFYHPELIQLTTDGEYINVVSN